MKPLPFTPAVGQLVIIKGGIVGRIERLDPDRVAVRTWFPHEIQRLVPFDDLLDCCDIREPPAKKAPDARKR